MSTVDWKAALIGIELHYEDIGAGAQQMELLAGLRAEWDRLAESRENVLLAGFRDCEELVISFLQREADKAKDRIARSVAESGRSDFSVAEFVLRSAALAIRLGQYKESTE